MAGKIDFSLFTFHFFPSLELFQNPDSLFRARVCAEEGLEFVEEVLLELLGVDDVELGNVLAVDVAKARSRRNLAQS